MESTNPPVLINFSEMVDRALLYISRKQPSFEQDVQVFFDNEYGDAGCDNPESFKFIVSMLVNKGLIASRGDFQTTQRMNQFFKLTYDGWQRADEILRTHLASKQAFVAMWFNDSLSLAYDNGIVPALEETGFSPFRVDRRQHNQLIDHVIISEIRRSGLLIADFTNNNPGVYFEAGYAMALGGHVIRTCRRDYFEDKEKGVHFDQNHYSFLIWESPEDLRDKLIVWVRATVNYAT